jgi:uncharacterized protein (DUF1330 family)
MPAYVVAWTKILDREPMARYGAALGAVVERYGGRILFMGPGAEVLEGDWDATGMAIIEFPSNEDARRWHESEEYAPLRPLREAAGPTGLLITPDAA